MKGRVTWIRESCAPPARQLPSRRHVRSRASSHAVAGDQLRGAASGAVVAGEDQLLGERQRRRRGGEDRPLTPRSPTGVESSLETSFLEHILLPLSPRIPASGARLRPEKTTHSRPSHLPQEPESSLNTSFVEHARLAEPSSLSRPASGDRPSRHRASCGVNGAVSAKVNPEMADLIVRMVRVMFQVKHVSATGNLFQELCKTKRKVHLLDSSATQRPAS
ncbi:hypothetical protein PC114_g13586 [Phytophthora cactorum]|nr:hypothetical protein PC114_g13586 [Phytophthora cactorum]